MAIPPTNPKKKPSAKASPSQKKAATHKKPSSTTPKSTPKKSARISPLTKKLIASGIAASSIIGILVSIMIYQFNIPHETPKTSLVITPHTSATKIVDTLYDRGLIQNKTTTLIYIRLMGIASQLKAGRYIIPANKSTSEIIAILIDPKECLAPVKLTIPEGFDCFKLAKRLETIGIVDSAESTLDYLLKTGKNDFISEFPFLENTPSLEGYLFPDTYHFSVGTPLQSLIKASLTEFSLKVLPLIDGPHHMPIHMTLNQIITLASIVEKEAHHADEMPTIASVYFNRLKRHMRLQADPTVLYALENTSKPRLFYKDLTVASPFNTYYTQGLPPGPIANPGLDAIKAVLKPSKTKYLYFVADPETHYHLFSMSYKEHAQKVTQMHKKRADLGLTP